MNSTKLTSNKRNYKRAAVSLLILLTIYGASLMAPTTLTLVAAQETKSGGVLNSKAIKLPAPAYPAMAKTAKISGAVKVDIVIDESGKVESAKASSGPTALRTAAVDAAKQARFTPTLLSGKPVKVEGSLIYNFTL